MAKVEQVSKILAKYVGQLKKTHEKHKADEVEIKDFGRLPAGIEGGVAQLVEAGFYAVQKGKPNEGEPYFRASGMVVTPVDFQGMHIEGLRTTFTEPLYPTPDRTRKTPAEHYRHILNQMKALGLDAEIDFEDLPAALATLAEEGPTFRFRTWKGEKAKSGKYKDQEPRTNETWGARLDGVTVSAVAGAVDDDSTTGEEEEENPEAGDVDLDSLAEAADGGDEDAQIQLGELAEQVGLTKKQIEKAADFQALIKLIAKAQKAAEEPEEEEEEKPAPKKGGKTVDKANTLREKAKKGKPKEEEAEEEEEVEEEVEEEEEEAEFPEVGTVYKCKFKDSKKPIDAEVIKVDTDAGTATVRNLDTEKLVKIKISSIIED